MNGANRRSMLAALLLIAGAPAWAQDEPAQPAAAEQSVETAEAGGQASGGGEAAPGGDAIPEPETQAPSLRQAYQREFAFLTGQKEDLEERLSSLQSRVQREQRGLEQEIAELEARVVEMRFFAGMTNAQAARVLGVSERTVESDWQFARAWLSAELDDGDE